MNPPELTLPLGFVKCGVLVRLKASMRAWRVNRGPIGKFRTSPMSMFHQPGPRTELRLEVPGRTSVTGAHALVS